MRRDAIIIICLHNYKTLLSLIAAAAKFNPVEKETL